MRKIMCFSSKLGIYDEFDAWISLALLTSSIFLFGVAVRFGSNDKSILNLSILSLFFSVIIFNSITLYRYKLCKSGFSDIKKFNPSLILRHYLGLALFILGIILFTMDISVVLLMVVLIVSCIAVSMDVFLKRAD